jgi:hypothetical protein
MNTITTIIMIITMTTITSMMAIITTATTTTTTATMKRMKRMKKTLILAKMGALSLLAVQMAIELFLDLPGLQGPHGMRGMVFTLQNQVLLDWTGTTHLKTPTTRRKGKYRHQEAWECTTLASLQTSHTWH